jgi:hypothetical protein
VDFEKSEEGFFDFVSRRKLQKRNFRKEIHGDTPLSQNDGSNDSWQLLGAKDAKTREVVRGADYGQKKDIFITPFWQTLSSISFYCVRARRQMSPMRLTFIGEYISVERGWESLRSPDALRRRCGQTSAGRRWATWATKLGKLRGGIRT